ncbi:MAG: hypothetical protein ACM3IJ_01055 [Candidatus Levyibacteriota bacterium]
MTETTVQEPKPAFRKRYLDKTGQVAETAWGFHNSAISSYEKSFAHVLMGKSMSSLIQGRGAPVVIDLMAPPATVHELLEGSPKGKGLSVSLPDHSLQNTPKQIQDAYSASHITWLPEDITKPSTWKHITDWLGTQKADLVIERAMGALSSDWIPRKKLLLSALSAQAWNMVNPNGGTLLAEVPEKDELAQMGIDLQKWVDDLQKKGLDIIYDQGDHDNPYPVFNTGKVRITKTPDSPRIFS